jgi:hypothetical protein
MQLVQQHLHLLLLYLLRRRARLPHPAREQTLKDDILNHMASHNIEFI